ncbi:ABC transporter permease [Ectobacillus ponti]|uniref:ABC transporter permease n=1 Tax=Ectobacillus ponti TaxID=2961894 RepID=A0AA42BV58_9BACI|nr:ABC transporter permease [Ectobacillus ponti]MCP8971263.1 ABC transporter permease [Ectobacillus ponti]
MRQSMAICFWELKRLLRNRRSYVLMFGMPLLFTLLFGGLLGGSSTSKVKLLLVDEDGTVLSKSYTDQLRDNEIMELQTVTYGEAKQQVENKKASGFIVVPKGFQEAMLAGKGIEVSLKRSPDFTSNAAVKQLMSDAIHRIGTEVKASVAWSQYSAQSWEGMYGKLEKETAKPVSIQKETVSRKDAARMNPTAERASGFSIMFVMIVMMSATGAILDARRTGVWYRLLSTPASKAQILGGYLLSFFLLGWLQFGTLMLLTHWLFDVQWGNAGGLFVLVSAMLLAIVGLALLVAGVVKTVEQQSALGNMLVVSTCMIGGVYWPLEIEPKLMQRIADFVPQTWAMRGFTELTAKGGSVMDMGLYAGILLAFAAVFFAVGLTRIRYK